MCLVQTCIFALALFPLAALAADSGVTPRPSASDYPVQGRADAATIAAAIIPPNQVSKMFSSDIGKQYIVVEVAIYPEGGVPFELHPSDFALQVGPRTVRPDKPIDIAPWPEKRDVGGRRLPVDVTAEVGIAHETDNDPVYGRRSSTGTYTGVGVSSPRNDIPPPPQPPDPRVDPHIIADKAQRLALAEGDTKVAVAGYLYFPHFNKRKKSDQIELKYAKDDVTVNLVLPK